MNTGKKMGETPGATAAARFSNDSFGPHPAHWDDHLVRWAQTAQIGIAIQRLGNNASLVKPTAAASPSRRKIVALVPARNEGSRIAFCLRALARYADATVYLDDCSDDNTIAAVESVAAECRVEKIIRKTQWNRDEPGDRNALLQAGRALGGTHFIVLDADEAFTANCVENSFLRQLVLELQPGDSLAMNWIQLWREIGQYRFDSSVWTWNGKAVIFADDGKCSYSSEFIHTPRVPANLFGRCYQIPGYDHGLLHFQFVNWRNLLVKQAWYRCLEHVREPKKPVAEINQRYAPSKDETGLGLKAAPRSWLAGYPFFDLSTVHGPEGWREKQVLGWFEKYGREHFRELDIWDIEWGQPAQLPAVPPAGCRLRPHFSPEEAQAAQTLIQRTQQCITKGDLVAARSALASALKTVPSDANLAVVYGNILTAIGEPDYARWEYLRARALDPAHLGARQLLGETPQVPSKAPAQAATAAQTVSPLVSAIVSTYDSVKFIRGCLEDLTGQTLFAAGKLEIVVIDSASTENERAIVEEFQKSFPNIVYIRTEERETIYAAWNRGIQAARGRYLTNANTDDRHRPDALAVMSEYLEQHPETALVYADQLVTDVPNDTFAQTQATTSWRWPEFSLAELERRCIVGSQPLWRRSVHEKHGFFLPQLRSAGDYEFWLRIARTENFHRLPGILGLYFHNASGIEMGSGHSGNETKEIRALHGLADREVEESNSTPQPLSADELKALPFRRVTLKASANAGFNPAKPDFGNTPVSPLRPMRAYRPTDPVLRSAVSIITPFFNTGAIFDETARTVLGQSFQQWEWLLINDCSTAPEAKAVLDRYRNLDPRIKVIDQPANAGPGAARNRGVQLAASDYIVLLDSDDLLEPTALEKWFWHLESHPEYAFVKGYSIGFGAKNYLWYNGFHNREAFLKENLVDLTSMIRKSVFPKVGGFEEEMRHGFEDWEFWLRCASHNLWGATVPELLDWYRRRDNHNDRWANWDSGALQKQARTRLQEKYQHLEKAFPTPKPAPLPLNFTVPLEWPAKNPLQKTKRSLLLLAPWMTMGGADKFNLDLVEQLTGRGWDVTCATTLTGDHSWTPEFSRFTPDIFALSQFLEPLDVPRFLCYLIESRQIDTVLVTNSMLGYQLLLFLRSRFPQVTFLDYCHMEQEDWLNGGYPNMAVRSAPCLDLSVVSSQHLKRWMVARSAKPDQIDVCYTNINAQDWEPDPVIRQRVRRQLELSDDHPVILYAGRVVEQKQPRVFAETMRLLHGKNSRFTAVVAGDGADLPWLKDFVEKNNLGQNVRFLGGVPNQRVRELMRASDIFFLPSQWEGIALSIYEAMACGLAVVGADVGGQRELVTPDCGFLLPRGEPMAEAPAYAGVLAELTSDLAMARTIGRAARARVMQHFALDQMGSQMVALIEKARQRHASGIRPPVAPELGRSTVTPIVESDLAQRFLDTGLEFVKKKDWRAALNYFERVHALAKRNRDANAENYMENLVAQVKKLAGLDSGRPSVSVVIPCYNYARFLPEAVDSVLRQTFQDFEIIIVNDGSTDNTAEVAARLVAQDNGRHKMRVINQPNSGQPAGGRNAGIAAAAGDYVLPLDADDKIAPTFLEKTVPILIGTPSIGVVYTHIRHFGAVHSDYACGSFDAVALARDNVLPYCSLYRRRLWQDVGGYKMVGYEDWDFWLTLVERGVRGQLVPEPLFLYRKHGQGMLNQDNAKRERLIAQMVCQHSKLYDDATRRRAQEFVARLNPPETPSPAPVVSSNVAASPTRGPLRLTYLISSILGVTGGNQTLLRQAEEMRRRGHDVTIVTYTAKPDWFKFKTRVIQAPAGKPLASVVPPSDVVVATYFINAIELRAIKARVKVYYAQGDQFVFGDDTMADTPENRQFRELSRASYLIPGIRFVPNSNNLANAVQKMSGRKPDGILPVCTDQTIFRPLQRSIPGSRFRLLIVGPDARGTAGEPLLFKGMEDIRAGLENLSSKYPHFTPVRMSGTGPDIFARVPCEFYVAPSDEMKTVLFGTSHIHIYASHYDSCPRPPQEAMAAGCAVVCTATSGAMEYCRDGENALLVPIKSPAAIADAVGRVIHDHALREKLVQGGLATAREFPREREWNEWEAMLYRFLDDVGNTATTNVSTQTPEQPAKSPVTPPTAIKLPPCALLGHLGPARELVKQKKFAAAWESALAAIQARPFHPEAYLLLGEIAHAAHDGASALLCGKFTRNLAPDWKPAKKFRNAGHKGSAKPSWLVLPPAISGDASVSPRLSVCLIVKNEEEFLGRCLSSVRGLANQIIVVDTGSTDRTVEIAREHGAQVHSFAWCDDFAAARNAALEHATGDWILSLDADEELLPKQAERLLAEMRADGVMAYRLPIIDKGREQNGCSYVPRLFRNAPGLFFLGRVHEQAFSSIEVRCKEWSLKHVFGKTTILHHGYAKDVVASRDKIARNLRLLEQAVEELPGEPNLLMNLGLELVRSGRREEGAARYWEAIKAMAAKPKGEVTPELRESLLSQLTTHLLGAKEYSEIVRLWELPDVKSGAQTASHHFGLGLALLELKRPAEAAEQLRQCVAKRGQPVFSPVNPDIMKAGPNHCLALCLAATGQKDGAAMAFAAALADDPSSRRAAVDFAHFLAANDRPLDALKELNRLVAEDGSDAVIWQMGGQIALSRRDYLEFARDWTGEAVKHFPEHTGILTQRAEALLLTQHAEAALPLWLKAHSPNSPRQVAALVLCEVLAGQCERKFAPAEESAVSRELVKWYRQLIAVGASSAVHLLHERMDLCRRVTPSFVRVWETATQQARQSMAAA